MGEAQALSLEKRYLTTDGKGFWGNLTVSAVRDRGGKVDYLVAIVEVIDSRRQALELLEKLNRDKSHFVSLVSHEFRTALTGIQGFSEMLRDDEDLSRADVRNYANDINSDAQRLARMINELLDLERMESGKITLTRSSVDLADLVRAAIARARTGSPGHTFNLVADPALWPVDGDADKLTQVLSNLISNAVKYSPDRGEVTIGILATPDVAEVSVTDNGLGIPPQHLERIFERYARIESENTRYIAGTGLGLPIAKQIVEMHGGTISVTSQPGAGSTFKFTLPWAAR
jgi:signal transduction histidine kinase